jgi:hypothetical protein
MAIVTSYDWQSDTWTHHNDNPARTAWRDAVAEIAEKAKQTLPDCIGRVDSAVKIVLAGDVELLPDGTAKVASQSNGTTKYFVVNGECSCKDYPKAPSNWCKHRIAFGLAKRANTLAKQRLAQLHSNSNGTTEPATEQPQVQVEPVIPPVEAATQPEPVTPIVELPTQSEAAVTPVAHTEAPASVNVYVTLAGRKVQVTLRDSDEERLLKRLETLLERFPVEEEPEQQTATTPPENWCPIHQVQMKRYSNDKGSWFSHKTANDTWCNGKGKGK